MSNKVLVTGAKGQLGQSIHDLHGYYSDFDFVFTDVHGLDLSDTNQIKNFLSQNSFNVVINCAAYTAVDEAESDQELAEQINHLAVKTLAEVAKEQNITLIHISTDYVFDGQNYRPYQEQDTTAPRGVYGATKLKGEQAFSNINPNGCMIRTSWVYSEHGNNFVKTMLRLGKEREKLGVIFDQVGTPTYAQDLARAILVIISNDDHAAILESSQAEDKVFHFSNEGVCSWYDFAKTIFELSNIDCRVNPIQTKDYPTPASRPHYSVMNKHKIKYTFDLSIPYWKDSLQKCLSILKDQN
ncbi:dTDP-4-dehydrorhamnose reductase [Amphritea sp. 1_MG-2023]|uniref:dTDP-4-dehydrorhamnose reductase n=1 Tax=Amphritea sp. 1_MG-2023 TaxID=3062670 RepID=UPI0026E39493|nr:dTDP-4-dehydrorhamnose reductase [Amphritea sp. 1_MG-2023]MDO6565137.1 dTDP-4-dehydrorhamnose reductase [Amphritea sp. 1_MG-2023]